MPEEELTLAAATELVSAFLGAWSERRSSARRRLLEQCWDEGANFSGWTTHVQGLDAMDAHIVAAQRHYPRQCHRVSTCEPHVSGNKVSFTWALVDDGGAVVVEGSDWGEVGAGGRFARITSFAGRPEPVDPVS